MKPALATKGVIAILSLAVAVGTYRAWLSEPERWTFDYENSILSLSFALPGLAIATVWAWPFSRDKGRQ